MDSDFVRSRLWSLLSIDRTIDVYYYKLGHQHTKTESIFYSVRRLFLILFAQRESVVRRSHLRFASIKFEEFFFEFFSCVFQFSLIVSMIFFQFIEFRVQLNERKKKLGEIF